jgi:two-component system CheB/CheR fusion protein
LLHDTKAKSIKTHRVTATPPNLEASVAPLVVAIGASAGGLEAFMKLLDMLPAKTGMAFVLIQHLDPTHESLVAEILSNHTQMPVTQIIDGMALAADHVFVIPPKAYISITAGAFRLSEVPGGAGARFPFDRFLTSLAEECGERAIAVVLTGTGSDGSAGVKAINENGGIVIVQDPSEAAYDGMPRSAIETGVADLVFPLDKIVGALLRHRQLASRHRSSERPVPHARRQKSLAGIIALLSQKTARDFSPYKETTLLRRVERRMAMRGSQSLEAYLKLSRTDTQECAALAKDMLIHVTRFFRDPEEYDFLAGTVVRDILHRQSSDQPIRVWVPGCSTGDEAYSLAVLFFEEMERIGRTLKLQIFATDVDEEAIAFARQGLYHETIQSELTPARLERFFTKEDHSYRVSAQLREVVLFTVHDVLKDPPFSRLDLVSCRNLLIYLRPEAQDKVMGLFHFALRQDGFLFLGSSETPAEMPDLFKPLTPRHHIYKRTGRSRPRQFDLSATIGERAMAPLPNIIRHSEKRIANLGDAVSRVLADTYGPASVLVNAKHESLYYFGQVDHYLKIASGEASRDVIAMARDNLGAKIRTAIRQASQKHEPVSITGARLRRDGKEPSVTITAKPVRIEGRDLILVSFFEEPEQPLESVHKRISETEVQRIEDLEIEVAATRKELEETIRELETANEELTASNEEAMSVNEEFHSTNEELQTSKEELQSLNEELTALNSQLQEAVERQRSTASDLQNILNSSDIATVFLDRNFNIRFFTPAAQSSFGIIATDVGRPLANLALPFTDIGLLDDARLVLAYLTPLQREIITERGAWYIRRILPYRSQDDQIQGVVITFTDISEIKAVEAKTRAAQVYAQSIVDTVKEPLVVIDEDMRVLSASKSFYHYFDMRPEDTLGRLLGEIDTHHLDVPGLGPFIGQLRSGPALIAAYPLELDLPTLGHRHLVLNAHEIDEQPTGKRRILIAIDDVTERFQAEQLLIKARTKAEEANVAKSHFLAAASHDLRQPLQTLRLLRGILQQKANDADVLTLLKRCGESLDTITAMLDSILDINQLEAGTILPRIVSFPIDQLLIRLQNEFVIHAQAANLDWRVVTRKHFVKSDPALLEQMIRNLLFNAFKYTKSGKILLGCRTHGDKLSLEVWDTGPGIPETELKAIFKDFHQIAIDVPLDRGRGLGLGLSIVQRLGDLLNHTVSVCSRVGKGSVFKINVPIERGTVEKLPLEEPPTPGLSIPDGKILVVEDDPSVRETLALFLAGLGYHVMAAANGAEALTRTESGEKPDIIIADYTLPGGQSGLDLIADVRKTISSHIPAIVLTGDVATNTLQAIAQRGDPHLTKPVRTERLTDLIAQLLTQPAKITQPVKAQVDGVSGRVKPIVFVVDDDPDVRNTLQELLELNEYQVEAFASGEAFLGSRMIDTSGCAIIDARMPGLDGVAVLNELKARRNRLSPIMITGKGDIATAVAAMKAGAVEFVEKPVRSRDLITLIERALTMPSRMVDSSKERTVVMKRIAALTARQREILDLIIAGKANKQIAAHLGINQRTVESHRALVMKKMGAANFADLIRMGLNSNEEFRVPPEANE